MNKKPENQTSLRGSTLVSKLDPVIAFRGKVDTLLAKVVCVQVLANSRGNAKVLGNLEDVASLLKGIMRAECLEEPLGEYTLFGKSPEWLHEASHHPEKHFGIKHPTPTYTQGELVASLNELRALSRELELAGLRALGDTREDITTALNRLSSAIYVLELEEIAKGVKEV